MIVTENRASTFLDEVASLAGGERIKICIQCGTCTGSCPSAEFMDHPPRHLFAMIRAGMRDEVLESNTIWLCASCYSCAVRCPKDIKMTDIMYGLKEIAIKERTVPKSAKRGPALAKSFFNLVNRFGRNFEPGLMALFFMRTNPLASLAKIPTSFRLMRRGRMRWFPKRIKGLKQLKAIVAEVDKMEGL